MDSCGSWDIGMTDYTGRRVGSYRIERLIGNRDFAMAIQIPDSQIEQYMAAIQELKTVIPEGNLLLNPSKKEFVRVGYFSWMARCFVLLHNC